MADNNGNEHHDLNETQDQDQEIEMDEINPLNENEQAEASNSNINDAIDEQFKMLDAVAENSTNLTPEAHILVVMRDQTIKNLKKLLKKYQKMEAKKQNDFGAAIALLQQKNQKINGIVEETVKYSTDLDTKYNNLVTVFQKLIKHSDETEQTFDKLNKMIEEETGEDEFLQDAYKKLEKEYSYQKKENEEAMKKSSIIKNLFEQAKKENQDFNYEFSKYRAERDENISKLVEENRDTKMALEKKEECMQALKKANGTLTKEMSAVRDKNAQLKSKIEHRQSRNVELENKYKEAQNNMKTMYSNSVEVGKRAKQFKNDMMELKNGNENLKKQLTALKGLNAKLQKSNADLTKRNKSIDQEFKEKLNKMEQELKRTSVCKSEQVDGNNILKMKICQLDQELAEKNVAKLFEKSGATNTGTPTNEVAIPKTPRFFIGGPLKNSSAVFQKNSDANASADKAPMQQVRPKHMDNTAAASDGYDSDSSDISGFRIPAGYFHNKH